MNEDEITNLKIMICNLDLSVGTKEKLYNQAHKIRNEIERLNNIIDNAIKGIEDFYYGDDEYKKYDYTLAYKIYHILKGSDKE